MHLMQTVFILCESIAPHFRFRSCCMHTKWRIDISTLPFHSFHSEENLRLFFVVATWQIPQSAHYAHFPMPIWIQNLNFAAPNTSSIRSNCICFNIALLLQCNVHTKCAKKQNMCSRHHKKGVKVQELLWISLHCFVLDFFFAYI